MFIKVNHSCLVLPLDEPQEVVLELRVLGILGLSALQREVLQPRVAQHQHLLRCHVIVDVVGLVQVEELVETLLSLE